MEEALDELMDDDAFGACDCPHCARIRMVERAARLPRPGTYASRTVAAGRAGAKEGVGSDGQVQFARIKVDAASMGILIADEQLASAFRCGGGPCTLNPAAGTGVAEGLCRHVIKCR